MKRLTRSSAIKRLDVVVAVLLLITCLLYRSEIQTIYGLAANLAVGFLRR